MSKTPLNSAALTKALRRLGNPYAKLQILNEECTEDCVQEEAIVFRPLTEAEREYVRRLENPYASLSIAIEIEEHIQDRTVSIPFVLNSVLPKGTISQRDFEAECRRIFRQYIPLEEKGRLRPHHRKFIERNRSGPPSVRYQLLERLQKYDLSDVRGLQAQFNREREELTVEKLTKIEQSIIGEKP